RRPPRRAAPTSTCRRCASCSASSRTLPSTRSRSAPPASPPSRTGAAGPLRVSGQRPSDPRTQGRSRMSIRRDPRTPERAGIGLLAMAIMLALLANIMMVRRRFSPLEELIDRLESLDPADFASFEEPPAGGEMEEVHRLSMTFKRLLQRIEAERRRSGRLVLRAQEEERKRVARDLHDEVNQALTAILLRLQALMHDAPSPELTGELAELKRLVNQAMEELLQLARQLRPTALDDHGLMPALEGQVRRFGDQHGIEARLHAEGTAERLGDDQQIVVYRVAQEALANVARHARASQVE